MASNPESPAKFFTLLSYVILVASLAHACLGGSGSESAVTDLSLISAEKVKLDLYYETLCPFSAKFIAEQLPRIFDNGLIDIITLQLVPWGNAVVRPNKTFECQVLFLLCWSSCFGFIIQPRTQLCNGAHCHLH